MENLYRTLDEKKKQIGRFNTKVEGDYFLYFVEGFLPELINSTIRGLRMKDVDKIDTLNDILIKYKIFFMPRFSETVPEYSVRNSEKIAFIHLPKSDAEELLEKIFSFFKNNKMITAYGKNGSDTIEIETTLFKLIGDYGLELSKEGKTAEGFEEVESLTSKANNKVSYLTSALADNVHAPVFEKEFLDKYIVKIIKDKINSLNQRNFPTRNAETALIVGKIVIKEEKQQGGHITIKSDEVDQTLRIMKDFMREYKLGMVEYTYQNGIVISFNTTLADLMDAYYMEKQRIEHYTSGDYLIKEAEPTAKKLK